MSLRASVDVALAPQAAFDEFVDELIRGLGRTAVTFEPNLHGAVVENGSEIGRVTAWDAGRRIAADWHPADWLPDASCEITVTFGPLTSGTRVAFELDGWESILGESGGDLLGWFAGQVAVPILKATAPGTFVDWFTDRKARRPSGKEAREGYRDPLYHRPNFLAIFRRPGTEAVRLSG